MIMNHYNLQTALAPRPFRYYPRITSTNDAALEWLREGAKDGSVVVAEEQTEGRGRLGRKWYTPPGVALAFSVILRPSLDALPQVTMLGGLAVYELLEALNEGRGEPHRVGIKWVNDVLLNGKKVCGVLTEAVWEGDRLLGAVLGIGVNVRVRFEVPELEHTATNVETALGRTFDRIDLLRDLLARIEHWALRLGSAELFTTWRAHLVTLGQPVTVGSISGIALDVDPDGALRVQTADGAVQRVMAGDVA